MDKKDRKQAHAIEALEEAWSAREDLPTFEDFREWAADFFADYSALQRPLWLQALEPALVMPGLQVVVLGEDEDGSEDWRGLVHYTRAPGEISYDEGPQPGAGVMPLRELGSDVPAVEVPACQMRLDFDHQPTRLYACSLVRRLTHRDRDALGPLNAALSNLPISTHDGQAKMLAEWVNEACAGLRNLGEW